MSDEVTPADEGLSKLKQIRAARGGKLKTAANRRRTTTGPARSTRPATKKTGDSPGKQIATTLTLASSVVELAKPVHAAIMRNQAAQLGDILDRLAAQDPRVAELLERITGVTKTGMYVELAMFGVTTGAALAVASGVDNPVVQMLGASVAVPAAMEAAERIAAAEAKRLGLVDGEGNPLVDPDAVTNIAAQLMAPRPKTQVPATAEAESESVQA